MEVLHPPSTLSSTPLPYLNLKRISEKMVIFIKILANVYILMHIVRISLHNSLPWAFPYIKYKYNRYEAVKFNLIISVQVINEEKYRK